MKIGAFKYIIKEGLINSYRNKLMSLASVSIIMASLMIFGIFYILVMNMNYNAELLKQQPQVQVFCFPELDDKGVAIVQQLLDESDLVREYRLVPKSEAFDNLKKMLDDSEELLEGFEDDSFLNVSFIIRLKDPSKSELFASAMEKVTGIEAVKYVQETIDIITQVANSVRAISGAIMVLLLIVSVFIIANTIKLALFARRKEIGIMKYIGATDWYIQWPFIIEGVIIGLTGAIFSFVLTGYGYDIFLKYYSSDLIFSINSMLKFVGLESLWMGIAGWFALIGVFVGASGSYVSIRRYLRV